MDKVKRLKSYSEKDYTEKIDFPVELVGRDGVVRKYSYADSVRIYERRIESAHVRYNDPTVAGREIDHCTKRIEQLRRSWRELMHSSERQFMELHPGNQAREPYERGKDFLSRYIEERLGPGALMAHGSPHLALLEELEYVQTFYVDWPQFNPGTILYVFDIAADSREEILRQYHEHIERLKLFHQAPDTEKLIECQEEKDMAFVLTGARPDALMRQRESMRVVAVQVVADDSEPDGENPWYERVLLASSDDEQGPYVHATEALRRNDLENAFHGFKEALDENPHHKEAYWVLGALCDVQQRWQEGESYQLMGARYFPEDARIHYYYGIALFRRQAYSEALRQFEQAVQLQIKVGRAHGFLASTQAMLGQYRQADATLARALQLAPRDQSLLRLVVPLRRSLHWERQSLALGFLALTLALAMALVFTGPLTWVMVGAVGALLLAFRLRSRRVLREIVLDWARPSSSLLPE